MVAASFKSYLFWSHVFENTSKPIAPQHLIRIPSRQLSWNQVVVRPIPNIDTNLKRHDNALKHFDFDDCSFEVEHAALKAVNVLSLRVVKSENSHTCHLIPWVIAGR